MNFLTQRLGFDFGTSEVVVYKAGVGIVFREPAIVAVSNTDKRIIAFGEEAREMIGKMPDSITLLKPIRNGAIHDYKICVKYINYILHKVLGFYSFFKPEIILSVPSSISGTEKRAVVEAFMEAGARDVYVVKEPVLAAIGSGVPIHEPVGKMIVNIGGGTTDIAVISLGGVVYSKSIKVGGNKFDESIMLMVKNVHGVMIGEKSAEIVKKTIGSAVQVKEEKVVKIRGRDFETGQPKEINIETNQVLAALKNDLEDIISCAKEVFAETPPELASDIMDNGILVSGNGAQLANFPLFFRKVLNIPAELVEHPKDCVAIGLGIVISNIDTYKRALVSKN